MVNTIVSSSSELIVPKIDRVCKTGSITGSIPGDLGGVSSSSEDPKESPPRKALRPVAHVSPTRSAMSSNKENGFLR